MTEESTCEGRGKEEGGEGGLGVRNLKRFFFGRGREGGAKEGGEGTGGEVKRERGQERRRRVKRVGGGREEGRKGSKRGEDEG